MSYSLFKLNFYRNERDGESDLSVATKCKEQFDLIMQI